MHFVDWLLTQRHRQDRIGELAEQFQVRKPPASDDLPCLRIWLALENGSEAAHATLVQAHAEWEVSRHLPPINAWRQPSLASN